MNFYKSTHILEYVACDDYNNLDQLKKDEILNDFYNLKDNEKPIKFRQLKFEDIEIIFNNLNNKLKEQIKLDFPNDVNDQIKIFHGSKNNKIGADAYFLDKNEKIINLEMKFGNETLSNKGQKFMDDLFNLKENNDFTFKKMNEIIKNHQRNLIDNGIVDKTELVNHLKIKLNEIVKEIKKLDLTINNKFLNSLLISVGSSENIKNKLIKYYISPNEIILKQIIYNNDIWKINDINVSNSSSRIEINITNSNEKYILKFLLNWKNNYRYKNISFPAKTGGSTSSWNIWLDKN